MSTRTSPAARALEVLGDPTRRAIFESVAKGTETVTELGRGLEVTRPAVSQHLRALREAGLVTFEAKGKRRVYRVDPKGLAAVTDYIEDIWTDVFSTLKRDSSIGGGI